MFCKQCRSELPDGALFCKKCGEKVSAQPTPQMTKKPKKGINPAVIGGVCFAAVIAVTAVVLVNFTNSFNDISAGESGSGTAAPNEDIASYVSAETTKAEDTEITENAEETAKPEDDDIIEMTEADRAEVKSFLKQYNGEWKVKKFYDGKEWSTYELGKKMAIVAYNFLNDRSWTTGGYNKIVGYTPTEYRDTVIAGTDIVLEHKKVGGGQAIYEYVPMEYHEYHGKDIEYSCPYIVIKDDMVDMSGMGGFVYPLELFRVKTIKKRDYLVSEICGFALTFDGDYLEYCELGAYGHYQGYFAFDPYDSLVNLTATHNTASGY